MFECFFFLTLEIYENCSVDWNLLICVLLFFLSSMCFFSALPHMALLSIQATSPERRFTQKEIIAGEERPKYLLIKQHQDSVSSGSNVTSAGTYKRHYQHLRLDFRLHILFSAHFLGWLFFFFNAKNIKCHDNDIYFEAINTYIYMTYVIGMTNDFTI